MSTQPWQLRAVRVRFNSELLLRFITVGERTRGFECIDGIESGASVHTIQRVDATDEWEAVLTDDRFPLVDFRYIPLINPVFRDLETHAPADS